MKEFLNQHEENEYYERLKAYYDTCLIINFVPVYLHTDSGDDVENISITYFNLDEYLVYRDKDDEIEKALDKAKQKLMHSNPYSRIQFYIRYQSRKNKEKVFSARYQFNVHDIIGISGNYVKDIITEQFNKMIHELLLDLLS